MSEPETDVWDKVRHQLRILEQQQAARQADPMAQAEKLARRAHAFRERVQSTQRTGATLPMILFSTYGTHYGLPLDSVVEIQPLESFSLVPRSPAFIDGVVHFRGTILSLFNLGRLLGTTVTGISDVHFYLVARGAGRTIAISAGDVNELTLIDPADIKAAPEWGGRIPANWIRGVYRQDCLLLHLDAILEDDLVSHWQRGGLPSA